MKGSELVGLKYEPIFDYFAGREGAFVVCADSYVTNESGTGIVHQVRYFSRFFLKTVSELEVALSMKIYPRAYIHFNNSGALATPPATECVL